MNKLLQDKVAVVTGGSQGLGLSIAGALAMDGARVLLVSRQEDKLKSAVSKIEKLAGLEGGAAGYAADITLPETADKALREAVSKFGKVDSVVNSAGVFVWKKFLNLTLDDWQRTLNTNLSAPFFLTQAAAKLMVEQGSGGCIINITSIHGSVGNPNVVAHCASKFGLEGLTQACAEALREFDIRVNAIAPGAIEEDSGDRRGKSLQQKVTQADVATLVVYLASDLARSVTGATIQAFGNTRMVIKT